jgi:malonyl-CoA O-methyltransferase
MSAFMADDFLPNKHRVAQSFSQAAIQYDDVAILQRQTGDELLDRLSLVKLEPKTILDLGAGTGRNLIQLGLRYPQAQLVAVDIAPAMLTQAQQMFRQAAGLKQWLPNYRKPVYLVGDAEALALEDNSVDLVFANLAIQWCNLEKTFTEVKRVLKPEGLFVFTTLGPDSLFQLREAWASVDNYPHVNVFYDMHDVGEAMMKAGLADPVLDREQYILTYDTAMDLMKDLKVLGARNVNEGRRRGLTGKKALQQVAAYYEQFREEGVLPASYEVIFGHAWNNGMTPQQVDSVGNVHIPISQIQRR